MERFKEVIRNIFSIPELRRRILITLALLAVFRLGSFIPLPGLDVKAISDWIQGLEAGMGQQMFGLINIFSGGAMSQMSLFSLGIMPYISASIIFQLLVKVIPSLEAITKEGPSGYRKIAQYTRYATVAICIVQSFFVLNWLSGAGGMLGEGSRSVVQNPGAWFMFMGMLSLCAGTMFVMWLGEQISEYGVGNGSSLIIMAGIVDGMPRAAVALVKADVGIDKIIVLTAIYVAVVISIVLTTQAQRRIPIQHAKHTRGRRVFGGQRNYLPLRVNQAGVMPVIFASSIMVLPQMIANAIGWQPLKDAFSHQGFIFSLVYIGLVIFFTYFWTALFFQPNEMSNNLKEHGSFVPGIRPGKHTAEYLEYIMNRIALVGACYLCLVALMPDIVAAAMGGAVQRNVTRFLGGTGILIVVGVGLDMMQKIESHLLMRSYEGFMKKGRVRGRR